MLAQLAHAFGMPLALIGWIFVGFTFFFIAATAFWLWMLVDCLTKKRLSDNDKVVWVVVLLITHLLGAALYFALVRGRQVPRQ